MPSCWEKKVRGSRSLLFLFILTLPYILIWCHWYLFFAFFAFFAFMYITMCLHCYYHIVYFFCPFIFVNGLTVERKHVKDPYRLLLRANPVTPLPSFWVAHIWINKGCWLPCGVQSMEYRDLWQSPFFSRWVMWVNVLACLPQDKVEVAFPQCLHMVSLFHLETSSRTGRFRLWSRSWSSV